MKTLSATKLYTLAFGLFLGLCVWKFGNPVILDHKIFPPNSPSEFLNQPWPLHWANWILLPLAVTGAILMLSAKTGGAPTRRDKIPGEPHQSKSRDGSRGRSPHQRWLWLLPCIWLGWQFISAGKTVDADLTGATLWQFCGCVGCYFLGALLFARHELRCWLLPGLLAALAFCLVRGIDQRLFEYPEAAQMLTEGEHTGWTNFPPATIAQMRLDSIIITTNGVDVANPVVLQKFQKGRVAGTLVYPNALAGLILLLWPVSLALVFGRTKNLRPPVRYAAMGLTVFLGGMAFYWSGSKLGWLIGLGIVGLYLLRLNWPRKLKLATVGLVMIAGLSVFAVRFHQCPGNSSWRRWD
ncbi:MAG TPA: hypothetical protein VFF11_12455, partial [Candidatus Binatia bacterium]|nr:hypothetical protein [Candidatus Binatia bacterium]